MVTTTGFNDRLAKKTRERRTDRLSANVTELQSLLPPYIELESLTLRFGYNNSTPQNDPIELSCSGALLLELPVEGERIAFQLIAGRFELDAEGVLIQPNPTQKSISAYRIIAMLNAVPSHT